VLEGAVIRAGGLKDHARGLPADPDDEGLVASLIIGETTGGSIAQAMNIEVVFRDVNADGRGFIFSAPLLVIGLPPWIRSGQRKRRGRSNSSPASSSDGGQRDPDPSLAADERAATLSQRSLFASAVQKVIRQALLAKREPVLRPDASNAAFAR
jgi:hypothetical protein